MLVVDPVCEMELEAEMAAATVERNGEVFYFCSESCLRAFEEEPERFVETALELTDKPAAS